MHVNRKSEMILRLTRAVFFRADHHSYIVIVLDKPPRITKDNAAFITSRFI